MWPLDRVSRRERRRRGGELFDIANLLRFSREQNQSSIRELCTTAYLGDSTALCRVLGRYKMFVDTQDISISSHLMLDGYWEMWVTEAVAAIVQPGMKAADIGANLGYFSLLLADICGPRGHVHAFEPNPPIADRLRKSRDANGFTDRITIHRDVLGQDGEPITLFVPPGHPGGAYVRPTDADDDEQLRFTPRRLDSYPALADVDVIKIDAEAAEQSIWRGMAGIFELGRPLTVLLEFTACRYPDPGGFLDEITAAGFSLGYVAQSGGVKRASKSDILSWSPIIDTMLVLNR